MRKPYLVIRDPKNLVQREKRIIEWVFGKCTNFIFIPMVYVHFPAMNIWGWVLETLNEICSSIRVECHNCRSTLDRIHLWNVGVGPLLGEYSGRILWTHSWTGYAHGRVTCGLGLINCTWIIMCNICILSPLSSHSSRRIPLLALDQDMYFC